jgi:hypothetical protein
MAWVQKPSNFSSEAHDENALFSEELESKEEDDDEGESKAIPPLYICICKDDPQCGARDLHRGPIVYRAVTKQTPCVDCGHTGTLRRVN